MCKECDDIERRYKAEDELVQRVTDNLSAMTARHEIRRSLAAQLKETRRTLRLAREWDMAAGCVRMLSNQLDGQRLMVIRLRQDGAI